ncbi:MAG: hypothetical protein M3Y22_18560 [Pseudomonadota bacterium]|nr:hypothetical protein [Pseudomonadota bacterium]
MAHPDAFALKNSGLNAFLFADVGTELNGSALTILSVLARLGHDPWAEAARWAKLPKAAATDCLAQSIAQMPLSSQALAEASATASQLTQLLPAQTRTPGHSASAQAGTLPELPKWAPAAIIYCALAVGLAVNVMLVPRPTAVAAATPEQTAATHPDAMTSSLGGSQDVHH